MDAFDPCDDSAAFGGYLSGTVRYRASARPAMTALCHSRSCRRSTGAPAMAWAMFNDADVVSAGAGLSSHDSSPGFPRSFGRECGTSIAFAADYLPGMVDLTIGSLDDPPAVAPEMHLWHAEQLP